MKIYHNPRCTKSRQTLELLKKKGVQPQVILYLDDPLDEATLKKLIGYLKIEPIDLVRKSEPVFKEKFKGKKKTDLQWIKAMVKYPKLIERPIVVKGRKAVLGRPPENVLELLD